jgi:hypothetical protein
MTVSTEDAVAILRKWASEKTPVSVIVIAGGMMFSLSGFITTVLPNALVVEHTIAAGKAAELTVGLGMIRAFEYSDVREAQPGIRESLQKRIVSSLVMHSDGAQCGLYELATA